MAIVAMILLLLVSGCDKNMDTPMSNDSFDRSAGDLRTLALPTDSLSAGERFETPQGSGSRTLAGKHNTLEAYTVLKFNIEDVNHIDSLKSATLFLAVDDIWGSGPLSLELYETITAWDDSTTLTDDMFTPVTGPMLGSFVSTDSTVSVIEIDVDVSVFRTWDTVGALLLKNTAGAAMVSLYSDDSGTEPGLQLGEQMNATLLDTLDIAASSGAYVITGGYLDRENLVSEADGSGFVIEAGIPPAVSESALFNQALLSIDISERQIAEAPMTIELFRLTGAFTDIDEVSIDNSGYVTLSIEPDSTYTEIDIAPIYNKWSISGEENYGILVRPESESISPNSCVFAFGDSLRLTYTTLPEVRE